MISIAPRLQRIRTGTARVGMEQSSSLWLPGCHYTRCWREGESRGRWCVDEAHSQSPLDVPQTHGQECHLWKESLCAIYKTSLKGKKRKTSHSIKCQGKTRHKETRLVKARQAKARQVTERWVNPTKARLTKASHVTERQANMNKIAKRRQSRQHNLQKNKSRHDKPQK